jgi:hypothetical protein
MQVCSLKFSKTTVCKCEAIAWFNFGQVVVPGVGWLEQLQIVLLVKTDSPNSEARLSVSQIFLKKTSLIVNYWLFSTVLVCLPWAVMCNRCG